MPYGLFNTDPDDDYTYGSAMTDTEDEICDEIEEYEDRHSLTEFICVPNKYYIGSYFEDNAKLLFARTIRLKTFYEFTNYEISTYMYICSGVRFDKKPNIDIMQLCVVQDGRYGLYTAIVKTFWIKIIQRTWKKIMKQKKQHDAKMKRQIFSLSNAFQTTTRTHTYKGLKGMLSRSG